MGKKTFKRKIQPNQQQADLYDRITFLETKIINKISKIKKLKNNFTLCNHLQQPASHHQFDPNINYHQKFWQQYMMAVTLMKRVEEFQNYVQTLESSLSQIQKKFIERQNILNLPALSIIKKPISRNSKNKEMSEKREQLNDLALNSVVLLKKQEEIKPDLINYRPQQPHIFYE